MENKFIVPQVSEDKPYIEYIFNENGELMLSITSSWWGGINGGFTGSRGEGNTCKPKDLEKYLNAFKNRKIKELKKEIKTLDNKIKILESVWKIEKKQSNGGII